MPQWWMPRALAAALATALLLIGAPSSAHASPVAYEPQITNGHDATPGHWPFMVGLLSSDVDDRYNAQFCGGALVTPVWVLTAAHCVVQEQTLTADQIDVLVGSTNLDASDGARIRADRVVVHPDYESGTQHNDLTLIHLSSPASTGTVGFATPADSALEATGTVLTLLGWGGTTTNQDDQTFAHQLQEADMPVLAAGQCSGAGFETFSAPLMVCAGAPEQDADGGVDACQGDSGGPLFATDDRGRSTEVGIVSFGPTCGQSPTAYTRVSHYSDWIAETTRVPDDGEEVLPADVFRIAGADRYATAAAFALDRWSSPRSDVYLVTGEAFADALSVSSAAASGSGPVLLTMRDSLPTETAQALQQLQPVNVFIAGGTGAVSAGVEAQVEDLTGATVTRLAGADRYQTAATISSETFTQLPSTRRIVFIGSGERFADALGEAAAAANKDKAPVPLLLTAPTSLPISTADELRRLAPDTAFVLGGTAAIGDDVVAAIAALGITVVRIAGVDRFDTAARIADRVFGSADEAIVATGQRFPDGLVGGALGEPLLLLPTPDLVPTSVSDEVGALGVRAITILGGRNTVSTTQMQTMADAR